MAFAAVLTVSTLTLILAQEADARIQQGQVLNQRSQSQREGLVNVNAGNVGAQVRVGACVPANVQVIDSDKLKPFFLFLFGYYLFLSPIQPFILV